MSWINTLRTSAEDLRTLAENDSSTSYEPNDHFTTEAYVEDTQESSSEQQFPDDFDYDDVTIGQTLMRAEDEPITLKKKACRPVCRRQSVMIERENLLLADSGRAPLSSEIRVCLQEFRENLVDERVPEHRDSHASSPHELSLDPTPKRSEDLGKHSVYTHFLKDRNCEIRQKTKITRARAEDAMAEPYLVQKILVNREEQITKFSVDVLNLETIINMQSWCRT